LGPGTGFPRQAGSGAIYRIPNVAERPFVYSCFSPSFMRSLPLACHRLWRLGVFIGTGCAVFTALRCWCCSWVGALCRAALRWRHHLRRGFPIRRLTSPHRKPADYAQQHLSHRLRLVRMVPRRSPGFVITRRTTSRSYRRRRVQRGRPRLGQRSISQQHQVRMQTLRRLRLVPMAQRRLRGSARTRAPVQSVCWLPRELPVRRVFTRL
jgi:hypothetical protein